MKLLVAAMWLLVGACAKPAGTESRPASAVKSPLEAVEMRHGIYLARQEIHTTITPDGWLRSVRTDGKTYGPGDADPKSERVQVREGRLTPQQMRELAALFENLESLATTRYGGVPDGGEIELRYGDKTLSGGTATPRQVWDIPARINELTSKMPVVK